MCAPKQKRIILLNVLVSKLCRKKKDLELQTKVTLILTFILNFKKTYNSLKSHRKDQVQLKMIAIVILVL